MSWRVSLVLFACLISALGALRGKYLSLGSFALENSAGSLVSWFRSLNWSSDNYETITRLVGGCRMNLNQHYLIMCRRLDWEAFLPFYCWLRSLENNSLVELMLSPNCWMQSADAQRISHHLIKDGFYCGVAVGATAEMGGEALVLLNTISDPRVSMRLCDAVVRGCLSLDFLKEINLPARISQNCLVTLVGSHESIEEELSRQIASVPIGSLATLLNHIFNHAIDDLIAVKKALINRVCGETANDALANAYKAYVGCESKFEWEKFHAEYSRAAQAGSIEPAFQPANLQLWIYGASMEANDDDELFEELFERIVGRLEGLDLRWNFAKADVGSVQTLFLCMLNQPSLAAYQRLGRAIGLDYDAFMQRIAPVVYPSPIEIYHFPWNWRLQYYRHNFIHPPALTRWDRHLETLGNLLQRMTMNPDMIVSPDGQMMRPRPRTGTAQLTRLMRSLLFTKIFDDQTTLRLDPGYCETLESLDSDPPLDGEGGESWTADEVDRHRHIFASLFKVNLLEYLLVDGVPSLCRLLSE